MVRVNINGIEFNAADGEPSDFDYFIEGKVKANDTGVMGMVEEMKAFIRVQDKMKLRSLVDVGALFGVFSLVFTRYPDAVAMAIEPSRPANYGLLDNASLNFPDRHICVNGYFCAEHTGDRVPCGKDWKHIVAHTFLDRPEPETVTGTAIDDIEVITVDCMKIDVEGFECPVLRGARKTIERFRPVIFLEAHLQSLTPAGETPEGLYALLTGMGYKVCMLDDTPLPSFDGYSHARVICYPIFVLNKKV